jgi:DNA-binding MarR family transcriptional regulator
MSTMSREHVDNVNKNTPDLPQEIFDSIHAVMHLFRAEQYRAFRDAPHPLTHMEGKLLGFFARRPDATLSDLVAHSGRDKGQLARLIKTLKDRGLLEASEAQADKRSVRLRLTAEGRAIHQAIRRQSSRLAKLAVKGLDDAECGRLVALLSRVKANLEATAP